jgi:hypothetical protein
MVSWSSRREEGVGGATGWRPKKRTLVTMDRHAASRASVGPRLAVRANRIVSRAVDSEGKARHDGVGGSAIVSQRSGCMWTCRTAACAAGEGPPSSHPPRRTPESNIGAAPLPRAVVCTSEQPGESVMRYRRGSWSRHCRITDVRRKYAMNVVVLLIILLLLFGGGGFYLGGPAVGGGLGGLILLVLIVMLVTGKIGSRA